MRLESFFIDPQFDSAGDFVDGYAIVGKFG